MCILFDENMRLVSMNPVTYKVQNKFLARFPSYMHLNTTEFNLEKRHSIIFGLDLHNYEIYFKI